MTRVLTTTLLAVVLTVASVAGTAGCGFRRKTNCPTPASAGINSRDVIDVPAQAEAEALTPTDQLATAADVLLNDRKQRLKDAAKKQGAPAQRADRTVLCLSGGGSFGAFTAGVLTGWTDRGDRPTFDVVTGISSGALLAPFAYLGPKYDAQMTQFFTQLEKKDLYRIRPAWAVFGESFADNSPLAGQIDALLTPEAMADLADAHRSGRRLYVGTTEEEGKRFVVWDIGAMASRGGPCDRDLIAKVLLASTAAPGLFPSTKIDVSIDGVCHTERHVDGGVSQSLFFRPRYVPPEQRSDAAALDLVGTKVYTIVAGKLYADPEVIRRRALTQASKSVSTLIYAQTRGDLQRLYTVCMLTGMDFFVAAIPPEEPAPVSSSEYDRETLTSLYAMGRRLIASADPWRTLPPGVGPGETVLDRTGTCLTHQPRGPLLPVSGPRKTTIPPRYPVSDRGEIPATPGGGAVK